MRTKRKRGGTVTMDLPQRKEYVMTTPVSRHAAALLEMGFESFSPTELLERFGPLKIEIALPDAIQEDLENVPKVGEFYVPQTECFVTMTLGPNQAFTIAYDELGGAWRHRGEAVDLEALGFVNALVGVQRQ